MSTVEIVPHGPPSSTALERPGRVREQLAGAWLLGKRSKHTKDAYRRDITAYFRWCDEFGLDVFAVRRVHLDGYREHLDVDYLPATIARKLTAVSSFYRYLQQEKVIRDNPAVLVARPEVSEDSTTPGLDPDESAALVAAADSDSPRDSAIVRLLLATGLRVSEVCGANVSDLGTERGHRTITVTRKRGKRQKLTVPPNTAAAIDTYLTGRTSGPLFVDRGGRRVNRAQVAYSLDRLARLAGIQDKSVTPHVLRHTATTDALDAGASLRDVQTMCGHVDPRTTNRYDRARHNLDRSPALLLDRPLPEVQL